MLRWLPIAIMPIPFHAPCAANLERQRPGETDAHGQSDGQVHHRIGRGSDDKNTLERLPGYIVLSRSTGGVEYTGWCAEY